MRFANPAFLALIFLLVPLIYYGRHSGGRIRFSSIETLKKIGKKSSFHPRQILLVLRSLGLVALILAMARPQSGKTFSEISSEGVDIVLALDTSGSMAALDFELKGERVQRLDIVKKVVADFIDKRAADRMGIVVFGDDAYTQCPLTLDHGILVEFLKKIELGMAGQSTAIGSGIGISINRIKELKSKSKIIILLTDGRSNSGRISPVQAAELSKTFGIKIYTIGVGTRGPAPFLQQGIFGPTYQYQEVDLDEGTLQEVAHITGGKYYRATDTLELEKIYEEIDRLEKTEVKVKEYTEYNELFHFFVIVGLLFLLVEVVLGNTKLRKIP